MHNNQISCENGRFYCEMCPVFLVPRSYSQCVKYQIATDEYEIYPTAHSKCYMRGQKENNLTKTERPLLSVAEGRGIEKLNICIVLYFFVVCHSYK